MLSIFTPTYNRAYTLTRLFDSLKRQEVKLFEWIIIDDGSTDETNELVQKFVLENCGFEIRYEMQMHGGKHRAWNEAVKIAKYEWFMCVDSDDYLTDDAVSKVLTWIAAVREDNSIGVISGSRFDTIRKTALSVPAILKENPGLKCLNYERADIGLQKDRAEIVRTELLRVHPFPEYQGENFCTEGVVWNAIALDKKVSGGGIQCFIQM